MEERLKQLLLQDLCARLPYDIICEVFDPQQEYEEDVFNAHLIQIDAWTSHCYFWGCSETDPYDIEQVKPYLRPMSSMTEEEKKEFDNFCVIDEFVWEGKTEIGYKNQAIIMSVAINWLLKKHFDFMDLIPKGLAIEVTEENYG